jgi:hypothetical protein
VIARRNPGHDTVDRLDRVTADDEVREHVLRTLRESIAAVRRARTVQQPRRGPLRPLAAAVAVIAALAGVAWFLRRRSPSPEGMSEDWFDESYRDARAGPNGPAARSAPTGAPIDRFFDEPAPSFPTPSQQRRADTAMRPSAETTAAWVEEWDACRGNEVIDADGEHIGRLQTTYFDEETGAPEWALVSYGSIRPSLRFVPVRNARLEPDGIHLDVSEDLMHEAPKIDADGHISQEEEAALYAHYGVERIGAVPFLRRM